MMTVEYLTVIWLLVLVSTCIGLPENVDGVHQLVGHSLVQGPQHQLLDLIRTNLQALLGKDLSLLVEINTYMYSTTVKVCT